MIYLHKFKDFLHLTKLMGCNLPKMSELSTVKPIIVVLGATGTGKSKLAIEIASKYGGEIISADSMQVYKGMDIVTNKVTAKERSQIPHHILDFLDPSQSYNVVDFRNAVLPIIKRLHEEGKLPVIVGGTNMYVESILWKVLIPQECAKKFRDVFVEEKYYEELQRKISELKESEKIVIGASSEFGSNNSERKDEEKYLSSVDPSVESSHLGCDEIEKSEKASEYHSGEVKIKSDDTGESNETNRGPSDFLSGVSNLSNIELFKLLEKIDPEKAAGEHPNNRRKILRSLQVWAQTGVRHSEHLRRQSEEAGGVDLGGKIRFPNSAIFWVTCDKDVLDKRLDDRVDAMVEEGLLQEISDFHARHNAPALDRLPKEKEGSHSKRFHKGSPLNVHYNQGILQCIGFKEFHDFLLLDEDQRTTKEGQKLYRKGVQDMKVRTRQYSRRQVKWIRNRFIIRDRMKIPVFTVDTSDPSQWAEKVTTIMDDVVSNIIKGKAPTVPAYVEQDEKLAKPDKNLQFCETCNKFLIGERQWRDHMQGIRHRLALKAQRVKEAEKVAETQYHERLREKVKKIGK